MGRIYIRIHPNRTADPARLIIRNDSTITLDNLALTCSSLTSNPGYTMPSSIVTFSTTTIASLAASTATIVSITVSVPEGQQSAAYDGTITCADDDGNPTATVTLTVYVEEVTISQGYQNYPNPFNPLSGPTTIEFDISGGGDITFELYTFAGELVRQWTRHYDGDARDSLLWDGGNDAGRTVDSGVYIFVIRENNRVLSRKKIAVIK